MLERKRGELIAIKVQHRNLRLKIWKKKRLRDEDFLTKNDEEPFNEASDDDEEDDYEKDDEANKGKRGQTRPKFDDKDDDCKPNKS